MRKVTSLICIAAVFASPAVAQQPAAQPAAATQAAPATQAAATQPATQPAATQPAAASGATTQPGAPGADGAPPEPAAKISLNFKDAPLDAVLDYLSAAAGFVVMKDGQVEGRVTVISKQPVTAEEAVVLLGAVLKANGFTALQEGRVLRIVQRDKAKKGSVPVYFGSDPENIPASDALITQVMSLRNVDAVKLLNDLKPLLSPEADITASAGSNAIIVTDTAANIRRLAYIAKGLEGQEQSASDIRIIQLKNASAPAAAKLLTEIFKSTAGGGLSPQQIQMMQMQGQPVPQAGGAREGVIPGGAIDQALRGGRVTAVADERTNTVVVTAPKETLKVIEDIITKLDASDVAGNNQLRTFQLKNASAEETAKLITDIFKGEEESNNDDYYFFYSRRGGDDDAALKVKVEATFDERTNTVVVTAPAPTLAVVEDLIEKLDQDDTLKAEIRVFQLKNAEAFDVAFLLEDIFKPKPEDQGEDAGFFRFIYAQGPAKKAPKMTAVSDDRTNSVIVTAPTEMLKEIENVITKLDTNPASEETLFIYRLKNAEAGNLEFVLNTLFGNIAQPGQQGGPNQQDPNQQNNNNQYNGRNNNNGGSSRDRDRDRNRRDRGNNNRQGMPQLPGGLQRAVTELTGKVFVVADLDTNALLITTASRYEQQVKKIVDELDRPVPQVLIKVLVAEVTHNDDIDYGVDFSILNRRPSGLGQVLGTNFGNAAATGGLVVSVLEENVTATLRALQTQGNLDVLSRPYILASDNQLASIQVGQEIPRVLNSRVGDDGDQINQYEYRDIGILLDVTPHINPDGQVILDVLPEISALTDASITISPGVDQPVLNKRSAESRVEVRNGQTVVIGGLMEDRKTSTVDKVPFLGDIPLIGEAFKRTRRSKVKTELLIFLTPHVAESTDALPGMSADEVGGTRLTPNAVEPGMFQRHIGGMERGANPTTRPANGGANESYIPAITPATRPAAGE